MQPADNNIAYDQYGVNLINLFEYIIASIFGTGITGTSIGNFLLTLWDVYVVLAFLISLLFIIGIIYSYLKINEYFALEGAQLDEAERVWREINSGVRGVSDRWTEVLQHVASDRPNDWKLAIIEADIMLGEGLKERGYAGMSIGEQLRSISPAQMPSLQDAWDAHRIRNRIAHEGSDFILTQSLAREAIVKYERALRELGVV